MASVAVYVVEDSPIILKLLGELIGETGAKVVGHADTASQAITDIARLHPDAVTIDVALKRGTGFDVLEAMAISEDQHPPLRIMLSNHKSEPYVAAAKNLGADYFFDKANQIRDVVQLLATLVRTARVAVAR
jgi:DNA-binding NarL/FixJ family response regulator